MSKVLWLLGGTVLALAVFAVLNGPDTLSADGVEDAAGKLTGWGTRQRAAGTGGGVLGKVQEFAGDVLGDQGSVGKGVLNQATGAVRDAAGQAAQALGETVQKLNKA